MEQSLTEIQRQLFALQDTAYRAFQCRLMPQILPQTVIGVRTPDVRRLAKQLAGGPEAAAFLAVLPHTYYEENNLHAFLLEFERAFAPTAEAVSAFLPYVDNWATCDSMRPRIFAKRRSELLPYVKTWLASGRTYTVRFGIGMLMCHFLGDAFLPEYPAMVAAVRSEEYYVKMMQAWYFATALAKQWDAVFPYLTENRLPQWVHNKTIQKAVESYRITPEQKLRLRALKRA